MNSTSRKRVAAGFVAVAFLIAVRAQGQTSAALLVKPWEADQTLEDRSRLMFFHGGHSQDTGRSFDLTSFESQGRIRIMPGKEASPRLGYDVTYLNTHNGQPGFPGQLLDASVAAGSFLSQNNGWVTGLTLGLGYAGDQPFANGRAWYGRADFVLAKKFDEIDALGIGLDYDGHRTYAPDIPLPGFGWSHQLDPTLLMVVGVPVTSITWKPDPRLRLYADYILLSDFDINLGYEFVKHWTVYGAIETRDDAFYISTLKDHHRLLYTQRRAEIGLRWEPTPWINVSVAGGYGFGTRFENGWDYRNKKSVLHASPEPYVSFVASLQF